jgi:hypothetical protein
MEDDFKFRPQYGYNVDEFLEKFSNHDWELEDIIS